MRAILKITSLIMAVIILFSSCASTTVIQTTPPGAVVYADGQKKGTTPYTYSDTKIVGSATPIVLKKEGYEDYNTVLTRDEQVDVGAVIGGVLVWVPFLWTMKYNPTHSYELTPIIKDSVNSNISNSKVPNSTDELVKLQNLLNQNTITAEDFTTLKVKILNNEYDYSNSIADQIINLKGLLDKKLLTQDEFNTQKDKLISSFSTNAVNSKNQISNSTNELIKLQNLLDQNSITKDNFTTLKVKILNNEYDYTNSIADQIVKLKGLYDNKLLTQEEYNSQKDKLISGK